MKRLLMIAAVIAAFTSASFADVAAPPDAQMYESISPVVIVIITAAVCTAAVLIIKKLLNRRR